MDTFLWLLGVCGVVLLISTTHLSPDTKWGGRLISSVLIALLSFPLVAIVGFHHCDEGSPPPLIVLTPAILCAIFPWMRFLNVWIVRCLIAVVLSSGLLTASFLTSSYHLPDITGNPEYASERFWHTWITGQYPRDKAKIESLRLIHRKESQSQIVEE